MSEHTTEEDFQHFLSYTNFRMTMPEHIEALRLAYFHGDMRKRPRDPEQSSPDPAPHHAAAAPRPLRDVPGAGDGDEAAPP